MDLDELTAVFTELGAPDPEGWASSQVREGINQLGRFLFLKGAWQAVVDDEDTSWVDRVLERTPLNSGRPFDGIAHALRRMLALGVYKQDINQLVRGMQASLLFSMCYLLGDSTMVEGNTHQDWGLFEIDADGRPIGPIGMLHESVLATDPTGREMRPRPAP